MRQSPVDKPMFAVPPAPTSIACPSFCPSISNSIERSEGGPHGNPAYNSWAEGEAAQRKPMLAWPLPGGAAKRRAARSRKEP